MGLFNNRDKTARAELKSARRELAETYHQDRKAGRKQESDAFLNANSKVHTAQSKLPWWKRVDIDHTN